MTTTFLIIVAHCFDDAFAMVTTFSYTFYSREKHLHKRKRALPDQATDSPYTKRIGDSSHTKMRDLFTFREPAKCKESNASSAQQ